MPRSLRLALALWCLLGVCLMADLLNQTWAAGNDTPMETGEFYVGSPNNDTPSAVYQRVYGSANVEVVGGKLTAWVASPFTPIWANAGIAFQLASSVDGTVGAMVVPITYTASSISQVIDNGGTTLMSVFRAIGTFFNARGINAYLVQDGSDFKVQIGYRRTSTQPSFQSTSDITLDDPIVAGETDTWKLCWNFAGADRYVRLYRNDVLVGEVTHSDLILGSTVGGDHHFQYVSSGWENWPGAQGLAGELGTVIVRETCGASTPEPYEPVESVAEHCCGSGTGGSPPATGVTGEIPKVNPYQPYNPGTSTTTCVGEGDVPTASDLTDPENWRTLLGRTPNVLCELHATKHPATLGSTTYRWADQGLDLPLSSVLVEGRVAQGGWMEIRRAMALPDQYPEVSRAGVEIDEQDALIRTLLDDDSTSYLTSREWVQWLVSETRRKASGTMARIFQGIVAAFNPSVGRKYVIEAEDQITSPFGVFDQEKLVPQAVIDHEFFGPGGDSGSDIHPTRYGGEQAGQLTRGAHKDLVGTPIPILGGICSDRGYESIDGQSAEKGAVPLIWVRDCYVEPHLDQIWGELLVCIGEVAGIEDVYASDLGYDGPSTPDPRRASKRININVTAGLDMLCPGMDGWPFAETYRERTVNGKTLRYTAVYLRGPRMEEHRQGLCTAAANVCGPMGENGQVIDQAGPFLQWFLNEHVAKDQGQGYRSGDYHDLETYASDATVPYVQPTTFEDFQDYTKERLGNDVGYRVLNFQLRERISLRELEKRFMQDYEVSFPINHHGQKMCRWIDDLSDPTAGTLYREHHEEVVETFPPYVDAHGEIENRVAFLCDFDHDLKEWRRASETLQDDNSIEAHKGVFEGGRRLTDGQAAQPIEVYSTADIDTVRDVFARRLLRKRKAPRYQELTTDLRGFHDELGDQIRITHSRGVGATGYQARPFLLLEHRLDPNAKMVTLRGMDMAPLMAGAGQWAPDDIPDWDSATEAQRRQYLFWGDDDGTIGTDNDPGKEWR